VLLLKNQPIFVIGSESMFTLGSRADEGADKKKV
jgi:hypothetical protein